MSINFTEYSFQFHRFSSQYPSEHWLIAPDKTNYTWHVFESEELRTGNRCFEFYWKEGNSAFIIGFRSKNHQSATYFQSHNQPQIIFSDESMNDIARLEPTIILGMKQWSLVCINHKEKFFSVRQRESYEEYSFPAEFKPEHEYHIFTYEGSTTYSDLLLFNFGTKPFHYQIENGYLRWTPLLKVSKVCFFHSSISFIFVYIPFFTFQ